MRGGEELTTDSDLPFLRCGTAPPEYEVTFDGGAREVNGTRRAGAGAALWGPDHGDGTRELVAAAHVPLPAEQHAQVAEAWGARLAVILLRLARPWGGVARIVGDNLAVVRYCAGRARLHRLNLQRVLEPALGALAVSGWRTHWLAVRRRLNSAADQLATWAVEAASRLPVSMVPTPQVFASWAAGERPAWLRMLFGPGQ